MVVVTSNRTRDLHDALKRRCLYHWVEHPSFEREVAIVRRRVPAVAGRLAREVAAMVEQFRSAGLYKPPGVAETIDWAEALSVLEVESLDPGVISVSLGTVVKYREDQDRLRAAGLPATLAAALEREGVR